MVDWAMNICHEQYICDTIMYIATVIAVLKTISHSNYLNINYLKN